MKKIAIIALAVLALCAFTTQAAEPVFSLQNVNLTTDLTATPNIGANSTTNLTVVIDCRKQQNVMLELRYNLTGTGTDTTTLTYGFSVTGTAPTKPTYTMLATNTGTTLVRQTLNIDTGGAGYIHLISLANADAGDAMTNIALSYGIKMSAP